MTSQQVLDIFKQTGGYIADSHIVYTSGKHGSAYLNKDAIYPHTALVLELCRAIAEEFKGKGIDVVAAPALGGIVLMQWVAHHLSELEGREVLGVFTEKTPEKDQIFTRGYDAYVKGKNVLVVEDLLTTGGSVYKVVQSVLKAGGKVIAAAALVNRGQVTSHNVGDVPLFTLASVSLDAWDEPACPLCQKGVPINTTVGKGREYLAKKKS
jgi:orotate phosphoribosyltransferase